MWRTLPLRRGWVPDYGRQHFGHDRFEGHPWVSPSAIFILGDQQVSADEVQP